MAWETSTRRQRLPKDWEQKKAATKRKAQGRCEAAQHHPSCDGNGAEVDHITPGDDHTLPNLQYLSTPCHDAKTRAENAARNKAHAQLKRRPQEQHPGAKQ